MASMRNARARTSPAWQVTRRDDAPGLAHLFVILLLPEIRRGRELLTLSVGQGSIFVGSS